MMHLHARLITKKKKIKSNISSIAYDVYFISDQDYAHYSQSPFSFSFAEPLSAVESRKEESTVAAAEQSKVSQPTIRQKDIWHVPGISELAPDDDRNKESVSSQEQVSRDKRASEPHEGSPPDVHGAFVDKKTTTPSSSQAQSSDAKRDSPPTRVDADPSSGDRSTTRFLPDQGSQLPATTKSPPPLEAPRYSESNQDVPKSSKLPSADQEIMSPTVVPASAPDTQLGTAPDEVASDEQNFPLSGSEVLSCVECGHALHIIATYS